MYLTVCTLHFIGKLKYSYTCKMEITTKIILLLVMYGLPLCFAIVYRVNENIKLKRNKVNT